MLIREVANRLTRGGTQRPVGLSLMLSAQDGWWKSTTCGRGWWVGAANVIVGGKVLTCYKGSWNSLRRRLAVFLQATCSDCVEGTGREGWPREVWWACL
jgi:hypothetical protein